MMEETNPSRELKVERPSNGSTSEIFSVLKSPSDGREYRALILANKMRVILVSEPKTDKSAGSITVAAGCLCDPDDIRGIAHFCEHMLFLGTKKYPVENDFDKFLSDNGGSSNAYTDEDHTNYYFDVSPDTLHGALDRKNDLDMKPLNFAEFFISPLFTESGTEREINVVNSEHEKNIPDDGWRMAELHKVTADPSHPYSRFGTGTRETLWTKPRELSIDIRQALFEYHSKYYSANLMTLAVLGKESLDELQSTIENLFTPVVNKDEVMPVWPQNPYTKNERQVWINVLPVKDLRGMHVVFPFPDTSSMYESASEHYIAHLLGHEGAGSLLSLLKKKNWVNELSSEATTPGRGFGGFCIELDLTPAGLKHADDIITHIFQYLEMLRRAGPQKWVWDELRGVEAMQFRFTDKTNPQGYVSYITPRMITYPLNHVLSAGHIITAFKPEEITEMLELLTPSNCRILVATKENSSKVNIVEEFYGMKYSVEKLDPKVVEKWNSCGVHEELQLPPKNEFIPSVFDLKPRQDQDWGIQPQQIINNSFSRVWFLQDNEFLLPKAVANVEIYSPLPMGSPLYANLNEMLKRTVEDALNEFAYPASIAGLEYKLQSTVYGLEVYVAGYDHRLGVLLEKVMEKIVEYSCDLERFEVLKEVYERSLRNWDREQPRKHAAWQLTYLLREKRWTHKELIDSLKDLTLERLRSYAEEVVAHLKLEWLLYGNLTETESKDLVAKCQSLFEKKGAQGLPADQHTRLRELKLELGADYVFTQDHHHHSDSCSTVLFQTGPDETRHNVLIELLDQIACETCYNQLRTKEQLGYIVSTNIRKASGVQGLQILVQSAKHPHFVECRIDCYLESLYEMLQKMTEDEFLQHRSAVITRKSEKPKRLWDRARLLWDEIISGHLNFSRALLEVKELETVSRDDLLAHFTEMVGPPATKRRRLSVHILSKTKKGAGSKKGELEVTPAKTIERNSVPILDVEAWKAAHEFYPAVTPPSSSATLIIPVQGIA